MAWAVTFYRSDAGTVPARDFLASCPSGLVKPNASLFSDGDYRRHVRKLGEHYRSTLPRPVAA